MESEREKNLRRIYALLDARREPGFGMVISLSRERKKREARARAKAAHRLPQVTGPGGEVRVQQGPDSDEE